VLDVIYKHTVIQIWFVGEEGGGDGVEEADFLLGEGYRTYRLLPFTNFLLLLLVAFQLC
jgi:hypothetical protein